MSAIAPKVKPIDDGAGALETVSPNRYRCDDCVDALTIFFRCGLIEND